MGAGHFTTLTKGPSLQGENSPITTQMQEIVGRPFPARGELPQWYLCSKRGSRKGFVFAEEKAPAKELPQLSKALENGRITRERCFRAR